MPRGRFGIARARSPRRCRCTASAAPGLGAGLDGLQLEVRVLHRPGRARPRAEPAPGRDRRRGEALARDGVREITLLGQNVNSWGRDLAPDVHTEFGELLRACDAVDGIERIRFTSPHPKDFREPVIAAMAECARGLRARPPAAAVRLHAHPQGDAPHVLARALPALVDRLRDAVPDLALGTDIIVGFPGETEDGLRARRSRSSRRCGYDSAFTFVYSPRAGTEAAAMPDQVPEDVKRERMERLVEVVQRIAAERNAARVGRVEEVLVEGPSRTDPTLLRGRTRRNTTVNFAGTRSPASSSTSTIEGRRRRRCAARARRWSPPELRRLWSDRRTLGATRHPPVAVRR